MGISKNHNWLVVFVLVVLAGAFLFFYRMYQRDVNALETFAASYEKFDTAISDFSTGETDGLENKARDALIEFTHAASFRLSSLIKNDGIIPPLVLEIADFSRRELESLKAYKSAFQPKSPDAERLAKEHGDLTGKRKTAYARFRELAELKD